MASISAIVVVSMVIAPKRGLLWRRARLWHRSRRLKQEAILLDLYALASQHDEHAHPHTEAALQVMRPAAGPVRKKLRGLAERGWVHDEGGREWSLTSAGIRECKRLVQEHAT